MPVAVPSSSTVLVDDEHVGVLLVDPGRYRGGRRGQARVDATGREPVEDIVEPVEGERLLVGLQGRPAEDRHADRGDVGIAHHLDVLVPDMRRPLVGVVVGAVENTPEPDLAVPALIGHVRTPSASDAFRTDTTASQPTTERRAGQPVPVTGAVARLDPANGRSGLRTAV